MRANYKCARNAHTFTQPTMTGDMAMTRDDTLQAYSLKHDATNAAARGHLAVSKAAPHQQHEPHPYLP